MSKNLRAIAIVLGVLLVLGVIVWGLGDAIFPLILAFGLAYLVYPLVKKLETKGIPRSRSVIGIFLMFAFVFLLAAVLVIPGLYLDAKEFVRELPDVVANGLEKTEAFSSRLGLNLDLSKQGAKTYLQDHLTDISKNLVPSMTQGLKGTFTGITSWILSFLNLFLIPLFFFYIIQDFEKISAELRSFIPKSLRPRFEKTILLTDRVLSGYIRGQIVVALILGCLYALGLSLMGLRFGVLIGLLSGFLNIIPYAGFALGFLAAILTALANHTGMGTLLGVAAVFVTVQTLEGTIITPKFVGDKVGLSPLSTMLALIIGGNLLGFMGMIIAIPTAAIFKSLFLELKKEYQALSF